MRSLLLSVALAGCTAPNDLAGGASDLASTAPADARADAGAGDAAPMVDLAATPDLTVPPDLAVTVERACADAAAAYCNKVNACGPAYLRLYYGDVATCVVRIGRLCRPYVGLKGSSTTVAVLVACAPSLPAVSCEDIFAGKPIPNCPPLPGTIANGGGCADDAQCVSNFCARPGGATCGACGPNPGAGAACDKIPCARGFACAKNVCVAYGAAGAVCDEARPCLPTLSCHDAKNKPGKCAAPLKADAPCDPSEPYPAGCDALNGYYCHLLTRRCTSVAFAKPGQPCGLVNGYTVCEGSGACSSGKCVAPAADGTACDNQRGPYCLPPARCANGVCKIEDPATCS